MSFVSIGYKICVKQPRHVSWIPPPEDFVKINLEGSSFGNPSRSSYGGLIRNSRGDWLGGFFGFIDLSSYLIAKLQAIMHGLKFAWHKGHRKIIYKSDSMDTLQIINGPDNIFHPNSSIIHQIKDMFKLDWELRFVHSLWEGDTYIDYLAKHNASNDEALKVWDIPYSSLNNLLPSDAMGIEFVRH